MFTEEYSGLLRTHLVFALLSQLHDAAAQHGPAIGASDASQKSQEGFVDLRAIRFLLHEEICRQLSERDPDSDRNNPAPRTFRTQSAQHHGRSQHPHGGQQKIAELHIEDTCGDAEDDCQ